MIRQWPYVHNAPRVQIRRCSPKVRILSFVLASQHGSNVSSTEDLLTRYIKKGWTIVGAGGAGGDSGRWDNTGWAMGFVVLQRGMSNYSPMQQLPTQPRSKNGRAH